MVLQLVLLQLQWLGPLSLSLLGAMGHPRQNLGCLD